MIPRSPHRRGHSPFQGRGTGGRQVASCGFIGLERGLIPSCSFNEVTTYYRPSNRYLRDWKSEDTIWDWGMKGHPDHSLSLHCATMNIPEHAGGEGRELEMCHISHPRTRGGIPVHVFNSGNLKLTHTSPIVQLPSSEPPPCPCCLLPLKNPPAPLSRNKSLSLSAPIPRHNWTRRPQVRAHLKNFQAQACKARDPSTPLHQPTPFPTPTSPPHHLPPI